MVDDRKPDAFVVSKLDGSDRRIVDAHKYDPRNTDFWISEKAQADHLVIPLYPLITQRAVQHEQAMANFPSLARKHGPDNLKPIEDWYRQYIKPMEGQ